MIFDPPLIETIFERRYKRFLVDVTLKSQETITVHCPNTGSMASCYGKGCKAFVSLSKNPKRKLSHTLEITQSPEREEKNQGYVGVNTHLTNTLVNEALNDQVITELQGFTRISRETSYKKGTRFDFFLSGHATKPDTYLEVKNATLYESCSRKVLFPDAVSLRGQKHLQELIHVSKESLGAYLLFVVNRSDGTAFSPADSIDPRYGELLRLAARSGVKVLAYRTHINPPTSISLGSRVTVKL